MYNINPRTLIYYDLMKYIDGLGYQNITKVHYYFRGKSLADNLRLLVDDGNVKQMQKLCYGNGGRCSFELYTEHDEEKQVSEKLGGNEVDEEDSSEDDEEIDVECEREMDENSDSDVAFVDTSDDELQVVRENEREMKLNKKKKEKEADEVFVTPMVADFGGEGGNGEGENGSQNELRVEDDNNAGEELKKKEVMSLTMTLKGKNITPQGERARGFQFLLFGDQPME
ncbi:hypothetical protein FRX31_019959 [Thalictrum thalictroides]|uniref:PB1-like domain-containing protein n=1 Tax=Thalictrum thalictroides TaxID=46969 RepID=A0A7J6W1Q0_THATH|nr:hypothetical protein FRX31_019959 [Thalictrum thalictroides]